MKLSIGLVLILKVLGTHSHGDLGYLLWKVITGHLDEIETSREEEDICYCVPPHMCYEEDISPQLLKCIDTAYNHFYPDHVCCRRPVRRTTMRPPARRPTHTNTIWFWSDSWTKTKKPSQMIDSTTQGPPKSSTTIPARNPPSNTQPQSPQDTTEASSSALIDCTNIQRYCTSPKDYCCQISTKVQTFDSSLQTQMPIPPPIPTQSFESTQQISPPKDRTCTCTPFFKCYDEETSSNLTGVVDDRVNIPISEESCSDPNDVCCYNIIKITAKPVIESSSENCTGTCKSIQDCPYLLTKLEEAKNGISDAVQELRRSVCSNKDGNLNVCCPSDGPKACQFPFIFKHVNYTECTTTNDPDGKLWCSTQTNNRNIHIKGQWRYCTQDEATA